MISSKPRIVSAIGTYAPGVPVNCFGDEERLGEEALDLARALHRELVLVGELVDAEDRDDVLELLVALQDLLDAVGDAEVVLAEDVGLEDRRGRVERVDGRVDAFFGDRPRERGGRVEVREHRRRRRVGVVVGGHVDRLHRGHRALSVEVMRSCSWPISVSSVGW